MLGLPMSEDPGSSIFPASAEGSGEARGTSEVGVSGVGVTAGVATGVVVAVEVAIGLSTLGLRPADGGTKSADGTSEVPKLGFAKVSIIHQLKLMTWVEVALTQTRKP